MKQKTPLRCEGRWCETPDDDVALVVGKVSSIAMCRNCRDTFDAINNLIMGIPGPEVALSQASAILRILKEQDDNANRQTT